MKRAAPVVISLALLGCGKADAEGWAKDKLGAETESLRKEAQDAFQRASLVAGGIQPDASAHLPRPAIVLEPPPKFGELDHLRYHRVNAKLDEPITGPSDVKGIAVVSYGIWDASRFERTKTGHIAWIPDGTPFISVVAIDRASKVGKLHVAAGDGDDRVVELLQTLSGNEP